MIQTGIGLRNAEVAFEYVLQGNRPDFVLSIGFGGALYSSANIGDLIWPSRVLLINDGIAESIELPEARKKAGMISGKVTVHEGNILTLGRRTKKSEIGNELYRGLPFPVCDMETFPLAKMAAERGLPFFALRCITDRAEEEIPSALYNVTDKSGHYRLSLALTLLLRNPWLVPDCIKLGRNSQVASRNLWHAIRYLIETF